MLKGLNMVNLMAQRPVASTVTALTGLGVSTIEALTLFVQLGIAVVSFGVIILTFLLKWKEWTKGRES